MCQPEKLTHFLEVYQSMNENNLSQLADIYAPDITFVDPAHEVTGLETLQKYFMKLYESIDSISFKYNETLVNDNSASIYWTMAFVNKNLNKGNPVTVKGNTLIMFNDKDKVYFHRDYFDLGEMLYENLPLIGRIVRYIKSKLASTA